VGLPFTYQIVASESPTSYAASGLPDGLVLDAAAGVISGVPSASGTFPVTLTASNASGDGTLPLSLSVGGTPTVTLELRGNADVPKGSKGKALFSRTGDNESFDLPVSYLIKGTAKNGKAYPLLNGTITIPAGAGTFKLKIPINVRAKNEDGQTIILKLAPSPTGAYTIGAPKKAIITILDHN
jgi:hypothetical protein